MDERIRAVRDAVQEIAQGRSGVGIIEAADSAAPFGSSLLRQLTGYALHSQVLSKRALAKMLVKELDEWTGAE